MKMMKLSVLALVLVLATVAGSMASLSTEEDTSSSIRKPTIPTAWNATISGHLINFFPFTATIMQDRATARTRLDFALHKGQLMGSMLFDLAAGKGYFYDNADFVANARGLVCQPIVLSPKISSLLAWSYYDEAEVCGASCWQYSSTHENEKYSWIFKGQPSTLFSFETNPLHHGESNMITVLSNVVVGPQAADKFAVPSFCHEGLQATTSDESALLQLITALSLKSGL